MFGIPRRHQASYRPSRYPWVDYAKGMAIILVAYRHVLGGYEKAGIFVPEYLTLIQQSVYNFRMPLFFILGGIFVRKSLSKRSFGQFTRYKLNTILYPYLVWATLQLTLQIVFSRFTNEPKHLSDYLYLLYFPRGLDQFWFLYTIFNITMIFAVTYTLLRIKSWGQLVVGVLFYYASNFAFVMEVSLLYDTLQFYIYFALGSWGAEMMLSDKNRAFLSSPYLLLALLPFFLVSQWYWLQHPDLRDFAPYLFMIIAIVGSAFVFSLSFIFSRAGVGHFLRVAGRHSLYIYIMHVIALALARVILLKFLGITHIAVLLPLGMLVSIALPVVFYQFSMKHRLWFLYYFMPPTKRSSAAA